MSIYPQRQRCIACRRYFNALVLAGQWCSYECAGHPQPSRNPADWPREHWRKAIRRHDRIEKEGHLTQAQAQFAVMANDGDGALQEYLCSYCLMWHIGHVSALTST